MCTTIIIDLAKRLFNGRGGRGYFLPSLICLLSTGSCSEKANEKPVEEIAFVRPAHFPEPVYRFAENPVTREGFELGRALFYETKLSKDNSISCGACHQQSSSFTHHGHSISHGFKDQLGTRNSPPIVNLAWSNSFMWDGGVFDLDFFSIAPITNPVEMGEEIQNVIGKLKSDQRYPPAFKKAFGSEEINSMRMFQALSQFMLMCVSANSKYDQWKLGKGESLSKEELEGFELVKEKCSACHAGELFTDNGFHNNGIGQGRLIEDLGREHITLNPQDRRKFKTPTLRNLRYTVPYMHDGRFYDLDAVLNHYSSGVKDSPTLDPILKTGSATGIPLSKEEKDKIKLFLNTLNDENFIKDNKLSEFAAHK